MELPDCEDIADDHLVFSYHDDIELVRQLVEKGPEYIDSFIERQAKKDSSVARYIKQLRKRLERQAERIRAQRRKSFMGKMKSLESEKVAKTREIERELASLTDEQRALQDRLNEILESEFLSDDFVRLVIDTPLDLRSKEKKGILKRITDFFIMIGRAIKRFFLWLARKLGLSKEEELEPEGKPKAPSLLISFPSISGTFKDLDSRFGNALFTSENFREEVETGMLKNKWLRRQRLKWRRRFKKERYVEDAKKAYYDKLEKRMEKRAGEVKAKSRDIARKAKETKMRKKKTEEKAKKDYDDLKKQEEKEEKQLRRRLRVVPKEKTKKEVLDKLETSGFITRRGGELEITTQLVDRFADLVFTAEVANLPMSYHASYGASEVEGIYERDRLRMVDEISRMDIVESMVHARIHHPQDRHIYEDDVFIYKELRGANNHVVLMFDKSGSMDENKRILAAKKAVLALYKAVKERNPRNVVDLVTFDTEVRVMDLLGIWRSEASGFTNTGEAIKTARALLSESSADRKMVYLITDGLPEAYTEDEEVYAGDTNKSLSYAVAQAKELSQVQNISFTMILLEPKERMYVEAAQRIVTAASGRAMVLEPQQLAAEMLMDFAKL
ncbi:MAG: VWA domain-containing protein [Thermoplasmata archaeon]|nr:MAG: VWA domain-containing protein [Thermoplasmata archaeon]